MTREQIIITIIGISIIFISNTLGSSLVFLTKNKLSNKLNSIILGFASGVMLAASIFGLILPSLEQTSIWYVILGLVLGTGFILLIDKLTPHTHIDDVNHGPINKMRKSTKLFLAVTIHNIPEGLAVGVAYGSAILLAANNSFYSALALALGIAIQNFPEGLAVSYPIKIETKSSKKAFFYGTMSGIVEPIFAIIGLLLASTLSSIIPLLLSFAAGAMIYVTIDDLIPESRNSHTSSIGPLSFILGFIIMMILDVLLG